MTATQRLRGLLFSGAIAISVVACGGGGGGDDSPAAPPAAVTSYTISGVIAGGSSVSVLLSGAASATTQADASGAYVFTDVSSGTYTITPGKPGVVFQPSSQLVTVTSANATAGGFTQVVATDGLTPEDAARLDALPESSLPASQVILRISAHRGRHFRLIVDSISA